MTEHREDAPDGAAPDRSRNALAASTLRALRAGRPGNPPAAEDVGSDATAPQTDDISPAKSDIESEIAGTETDSTDVDSAHVEDETDTAPEEVVAPDGKTAEAPSRREKAAPSPRARRASLVTAGCAVLALVALVFAVIASVTWWTAGHSEQHKIGVARDQIATDARLAIVTVNTSDYRHADTALSNWLTVSTGSLHSQFMQSRTAAVKLLAKAQTVTKATVLADAVTALDLSKGTATVIASVNVARTHAGSTNTVRNRFRATMSRVGGQWKLSNLAVVPVSLS